MTPSELLRFWYLAAHHPLGVWLKTPDPVQLKSLLYTARAKAQDPSLATLQLRTAVDDPRGAVWIVNAGTPEAAASLTLDDLT